MRNKFLTLFAMVGSLLLLGACGNADQPATGNNSGNTSGDKAVPAKVVNVYSARHYDNDLVLYEQFTQETGIKVNYIEGGGDALIERISSEGDASPADIFITADAGILWRADNRNIFQPTRDETLEENIPAQFRHPQGHWFGLTKRARIIVYNKQEGLPEGLSDYEDLSNPAYQGMICIRPSSNIYNQSLLASLIENLGSEAAESWAEGVVANFARKPQGNDSAQIEAVAAGQCRLGVVNSYYVARYTGATEGQNKEIGERIGIVFPNQGTPEAAGRGTHVNISGAGILANAPNEDNARALLRFLLREDVQPSFAGGNNEYPIVEGVTPSGAVSDLGSFKEDTLPMTALGKNQREAVEIFDRAGWL